MNERKRIVSHELRLFILYGNAKIKIGNGKNKNFSFDKAQRNNYVNVKSNNNHKMQFNN